MLRHNEVLLIFQKKKIFIDSLSVVCGTEWINSFELQIEFIKIAKDNSHPWVCTLKSYTF